MADILEVNLGERSYAILFAEDLSAEIREIVSERLAKGTKIAVITDRNVAGVLGADVKGLFGEAPVHVVPAGEDSKSLAEWGRCLDFLAENKLDRSSAVFAVGGGVVGDLAGFAAASYLRGIDFYQVPTTLLSMVDSSVGGKTGINLKAGKNLVGAFHQPRRVFVATGMLRSLPKREFAAGMAEVIKSALLGDAKLFEDLERCSMVVSDMRLAWMVRRCCGIKARVVEADERELAEQGGRALLNLGHTFAHAIEQVSGYGTYLHGEAVAVGLCACARLSRLLGMVDDTCVSRIETMVAAHGLPTRLVTPIALEPLMQAMTRDKKARQGMPRFVLLRAVGDAVVRADIERPLVEAAWVQVGAAPAQEST